MEAGVANSEVRATSFFSPGVFLLNVLVGITFFVINFPELITKRVAPGLGSAWVRDVLVSMTQAVRAFVEAIIGPKAQTFDALMTYSFLGLQLYVLLVLVMCLSRLRIRPLLFAALGFVVGFYAVHLIAYLVLATLWTFQLGLTIFLMVRDAIVWFINFLFRDFWALLLTAGIVFYLYVNRARLLQAIVTLLLIAGFVAAVYYLAPPIFAFIVQIAVAIYEFLHWLLAPILAFLMMVLGPLIAFIQWIVAWIIAPILGFILAVLLFGSFFLLAAMVVLTAFASMGNVVTDQVRAAFRVRRIGTKDHMLNGFALGSALALVLLTCVAAGGLASGVRAGWLQSLARWDGLVGLDLQNSALATFNPMSVFVSTMPDQVHRFVFDYLTNALPPLVDAAILVALVVISCINVTLSILGLSRAEEVERPITFLPLEVIAIVFWLVFSIASLFAQAVTEG
jgi:hypothetical protein